MRKVDYSILAETIKNHLEHYKNPLFASGQLAQGGQQACTAIAYTFARFAHVDKKEFLKACGIENR